MWDSAMQTGLPSWQLAVLVLFAAIVIYGFRPVHRWRLRKIPGRRPKWFMGTLMELRKKGAAKTHQIWAREYGPVYKSFGGSRPFVFVASPELVRQVLLTNTYRPVFPSIWLGREREFDKANILAVRGEKHRSLRGAWTPMFFSGSLEAFSALMNEATDLLLLSVAAAAKEGKYFDIYQAIGRMTLQVVGTTAFGVDFHTQEYDPSAKDSHEDSRQLQEAVAQIFNVNAFSFSAWAPVMFLFPFLAPMVRLLAFALPDRGLLKMKAARRTIVDTVSTLIQEHRVKLEVVLSFAPSTVWTPVMFLFPFLSPLVRCLAWLFPDSGMLKMKGSAQIIINIVSANIEQRRQEMRAEKEAGIEKGAGDMRTAKAQLREGTLEVRRGVQPGSFIDLLMRAKDKTTGQGFTDLEIANQGFVMVLAGYETTGNALGFALYLLAAHPAQQQKLVEEVRKFGLDRRPSYETLQELPFVEACLKEALRLYPPAPTHIRQAQRDQEIGGYHIRKDQWVGCAVYALHRDPKYWQDPDSFLPDRFMEGTPESKAVNPDAWVPFGGGVRACVGEKFAMAEAKITLVRLFQQYTFELKPGQEPLELRNTITLSPKKGVIVKPVPHKHARMEE
ncbi:g8326 [Coccomyxa viridis]|uniref:G8326 protein n=1 Tax=Coccomyxa viridis TaxID=1274662 RepID=A0ABP1G083_9CHLO